MPCGRTACYIILIGDHLGSTSLVTDASGNEVARQKCFPYGAPRAASGTLPTDYRFTGQRSEEATLGSLYDYNARFYSPVLGRFLSPDSLIPQPGNPQALNRYSYTLNNPLKYTDPTGHWVESAFDVISLGLTLNDIRNEGFTFWNAVSLVTDVASVALPVPAGASHVIRAGKLANKAVNTADTVSNAVKLVNAADTVSDGARVGNSADNVADTAVSLTKALPAPRGSNPWNSNAPLQSTVVGPEGMTVYRAHGEGRAKGAWVSPQQIPNQQYVRESLAVRTEWNPATHASEIRLAPGTRIQIGIAGPQGPGYPGGGPQIQILNPDDIARSSVVRTWQLPR